MGSRWLKIFDAKKVQRQKIGSSRLIERRHLRFWQLDACVRLARPLDASLPCDRLDVCTGELDGGWKPAKLVGYRWFCP